MFSAYVVVTLLAIAANAFSGIAAVLHFKPILPGMVKAGVPESWLTFPIGRSSAWRSGSSCWPWPHSGWDWPRPERVRSAGGMMVRTEYRPRPTCRRGVQ